MMTAADTLLETQAPEQLTQIVKPDGSVGGTTEKPSERFLSAHDSIVRVAYVVWLVCRLRLRCCRKWRGLFGGFQTVSQRA